ncbi:MAG: hypothetical protein KJ592_02725, partial [Nanoarchaeota archaeon]|nr:hypothetical protein [Nanoarchaeota archaeon]
MDLNGLFWVCFLGCFLGAWLSVFLGGKILAGWLDFRGYGLLFLGFVFFVAWLSVFFMNGLKRTLMDLNGLLFWCFVFFVAWLSVFLRGKILAGWLDFRG